MLTQAVVATTVGGLFLAEHPDYPRYLDRVQEFGSDDLVIVAFEYPEPLSATSQERLQRTVEAIADLEWVSGARSLLDVQRLEGTEDGLHVATYAELAREDPRKARRLLDEAREESLAKGFYLSADGRHSSVVVELDAGTDRPAEATPTIIDGIVRAFESAGFSRAEIHVVGLSANVAGVIAETHFNIRRLFPLVVLVLLATVWIMFHRFWPVFISGAVTLIAAVWTLGFAVLLDRHVNIFTGIVPAVILIIGFSDVVHLCSAYLLELGKGHHRDEAILRSCSEVGKACLLTSVTTFFGFVSLSLVPTPVSRQLGLVLGFGAGVALLVAMTLTPILLSLFGPPRPWRVGTAGRLQDFFDRLLAGVSRLTNRMPRSIVLAFVGFAVAGAVGTAHLTIETDFAKRMSEDHPLQRDLQYFKQHFASANAIDVFVSADQPGGVLESEFFAAMARYRDRLQTQPEISRVYGAVDLVESAYGALTHGQPNVEPLPNSRQALAQLLLLFESAGGTDLDRVINFERQTARLTLHLNDQEFRRTAKIGDQAQKLARDFLKDGARAEASGLVYILGQGFDDILVSQRLALVVVFLAICLMMMVGLRSARVGLWSMIPNLLPLFALGGYIGAFWGEVDSDILIISILAIGIGVDDTIHFLMRFRIESLRQQSVDKAIESTLLYAGRGILITSVILVLGFAPFALSDYFSVRVFGTMLPLTLTVALVADLFLVPALARLGLIRFSPGSTPVHGETFVAE